MSEEGLEKVVTKYHTDPYYANESLERLRFSLRRSAADSPVHLFGEEHFLETNDMMGTVSSSLSDIDTDSGGEEFESFIERVRTTICEALRTVDKEGVFGVGTDRERVFVSILMGDQDNSILDIGRHLNPASTVARFEVEWKKWNDFWITGKLAP